MEDAIIFVTAILHRLMVVIRDVSNLANSE